MISPLTIERFGGPAAVAQLLRESTPTGLPDYHSPRRDYLAEIEALRHPNPIVDWDYFDRRAARALSRRRQLRGLAV